MANQDLVRMLVTYRLRGKAASLEPKNRVCAICPLSYLARFRFRVMSCVRALLSDGRVNTT